jgi:hypothetical protein
MNMYPIHGKNYCSTCREEIGDGNTISFSTDKLGRLLISHLRCVNARFGTTTKEYPKRKWWQL